MIGRAGFSSKCWRVLRWAGLAAAAPALWACTSRTLETPNITPTATLTTNFTQKINNEIDILFMIDNSSSMTEMQKKLYDQLPRSCRCSRACRPRPASTSRSCRRTWARRATRPARSCAPRRGTRASFRACPAGPAPPRRSPRETPSSPTPTDMPNYTDPIATVFQCIALLGDKGCGFEHQLASIDRALGGRRTAAAQHERRLPAPRGLPRHRHPDQRGRLLGALEHRALLAERRPAEHRQPAGPDRQLPLQPVRPPLHGPGERQPMSRRCNPPADAMMTGATPTLDMTNCMSNDSG